jgi:hypothetical protein
LPSAIASFCSDCSFLGFLKRIFWAPSGAELGSKSCPIVTSILRRGIAAVDFRHIPPVMVNHPLTSCRQSTFQARPGGGGKPPLRRFPGEAFVQQVAGSSLWTVRKP